MTAGLEHYASEMAARALQLAPVGSRHAGEPCACAMCGRPILPGDIAMPAKFSHSYTSYFALTPSTAICGWCSATREQPVMRLLQRTLIHRDGCIPMGTDDARAWLFLSPPEPPFAVCLNQSSATATFHLHWRTPVTIDSNLLIVRVDEKVMYIRRPVLLNAVQWCQQVADALQVADATEMRTGGKRRATRKAGAGASAAPTRRRHPFVALDRSMEAPGHGVLLPRALALAQAAMVRRTEEALVKAVMSLQQLWPGELWALATLAKANAPTPTRPEPITSMPAAANKAAVDVSHVS